MQMEDGEKLNRIKLEIELWAGQQGHDSCWYYPDVFNRVAELAGANVRAPLGLPSREEFETGCRKYQCTVYGKEMNPEKQGRLF